VYNPRVSPPSTPVIVVEESSSGLTRQRWIFSVSGYHITLNRYHYERRHSKANGFKLMKFYDRGREPGETYGDWVWLDESAVPWDSNIQAKALAQFTQNITVGRESDFIL